MFFSVEENIIGFVDIWIFLEKNNHKIDRIKSLFSIKAIRKQGSKNHGQT